MIIPKKLKVGGHTYQIVQGYQFQERIDLTGQADHSLLTIRLGDRDQNGALKPRSKVEATFIHELLHCVDDIYNSSKLEEVLVDRLAEGLYQVLNDNGLLKGR